MGDFNFYIQGREGNHRPTCHRKITYLSSPRQQFERHASPRPWVLEFLFHCSLFYCCWIVVVVVRWLFRSVGNLRSPSAYRRHLSFLSDNGFNGGCMIRTWSLNDPNSGQNEDPGFSLLDFQNPTSINMSARWWVQRAAINYSSLSL